MTCRQRLLPLMLALAMPATFDPALVQDRSAKLPLSTTWMKTAISVKFFMAVRSYA